MKTFCIKTFCMKPYFKQLFIPICISALFGLPAVSSYIQSDTAREQAALSQELSAKLLRFRVLANSDSTADQAQKNKVSQALASWLRPMLSSCSSKEEARAALARALPAVEKKANELAALYGKDYDVSCCLGPHTFPAKLYQDLAFPAGEYDTFLVTIGDGAGSNWWCLAYPPLCFAEESYVTVPQESDAKLQELLSDEAYDSLHPEIPGESAPQKDVSFCFGLFPFFNRFLHEK